MTDPVRRSEDHNRSEVEMAEPSFVQKNRDATTPERKVVRVVVDVEYEVNWREDRFSCTLFTTGTAAFSFSLLGQLFPKPTN